MQRKIVRTLTEAEIDAQDQNDSRNSKRKREADSSYTTQQNTNYLPYHFNQHEIGAQHHSESHPNLGMEDDPDPYENIYNTTYKYSSYPISGSLGAKSYLAPQIETHTETYPTKNTPKNKLITPE